MKIGVVGDVHWSKHSSIVRSRGSKYSTRLENCIRSVNWAEQATSGCDLVVYLGDFFDKSELSAEELSALNELKWNGVPHKFLVGNHEMGLNDLTFSSSHTFNLRGNFEVIDTPTIDEENKIFYLPYVLEDKRNPFGEYVSGKDYLVFSHNDLKGVQLGGIISSIGFGIEEIEDNCKLFVNGHLHNGGSVSSKIINLGNLTGQNFSEDATKYRHRICIMDTEGSGKFIENPYAFNFLKIDLTERVLTIESIKYLLDRYGSSNPVVMFKVNQRQKPLIDEVIKRDNLISRTVIETSHESNNTVSLPSLSVDHVGEFKKYILEELGNDELVLEELASIL